MKKIWNNIGGDGQTIVIGVLVILLVLFIKIKYHEHDYDYVVIQDIYYNQIFTSVKKNNLTQWSNIVSFNENTLDSIVNVEYLRAVKVKETFDNLKNVK